MTDFNEPTDALDYNKALECTFTGNNVFDHYKIEQTLGCLKNRTLVRG